MTFIYKRKQGLKGRLYHRYMYYIVSSKYIDRFVCFAQEECNYYSEMFGVDMDKFVFTPVGIDAMSLSKFTISDDGTIFAPGRSNRDYQLLVNVAQKLPYHFVIACDTLTMNHCPDNVEILHDCFGTKMREQMSKCHIVVVPLKDLNVSSGQLVILHAMAMGKPIVCTDCAGVKDYVVNGQTGKLVTNQDENWANAILQMYSDNDTYKRMQYASQELYRKSFTEIAMFERIAHIEYQKD